MSLGWHRCYKYFVPNGTFKCLGAEPFDGSITFDFSVIATTEEDFRFKWQIDTGGGFADLTDNVEAFVSLKDAGDNASKTFPLTAETGERSLLDCLFA